MKEFHIHLVSDSTGETAVLVARACLSQFDGIVPKEHVWSMVRSQDHVSEVVAAIREYPGVVLYTLVDPDMRRRLEEGCRRLMAPHIPILDPVLSTLGGYLNAKVHARPGGQHLLDADYFKRIEAMHFALSHDDGQCAWDIDDADVVLVGVSRTSKTPTSVYLANRGVKTANIPFVPGVAPPDSLLKACGPLIVGLINDPRRLVEIRRQRLKLLNQDDGGSYVDIDAVKQELTEARRLFSRHGWPVINVTRRSIEETAANVLQLYAKRQGAPGQTA